MPQVTMMTTPTPKIALQPEPPYPLREEFFRSYDPAMVVGDATLTLSLDGHELAISVAKIYRRIFMPAKPA